MRVSYALSMVTIAFAVPAQAEIQWAPVGGELALRYGGYFEGNEFEDRDHTLEIQLDLELTAQLSEKLQLTITPVLRGDTADRTASEFQFLENELQRPAATLREFHLTYYGGSFELSIGKQIFSWGVGAGLRPTDNLNPVDLLNVPRAEKIGVPALSFFRFGDSVNVELVAVPFFTPHRLPGFDNRWAVIPREVAEDFRATFGVDPIFRLEDRRLPDRDLENIQAGLRLSSSSLVSGWDLELGAFRGFDPFGVMIDTDAPPNVDLTVLYPEYWNLGSGFSTIQGRAELHASVAYHHTVRSELDDDYLQYVGGFNFTFDGGLGSIDRIVVGLEYLGEAVTRKRPASSPTIDTGFNRALTIAALAALSIEFSERTRLALGGTFNFADDGYYVRLGLTQKAFDSLELQVGIDLFKGDSESYYGNWENIDRAFLFLTYSF